MIKAKNLSGDIYIYNAKNVYEFKSKFNIPVKMLKMFSFNNQNELENTVLLNENENCSVFSIREQSVHYSEFGTADIFDIYVLSPS